MKGGLKEENNGFPKAIKKTSFGKLILSYGVIGNTSGFEPEESKFEPWWDNKSEKIHKKTCKCKK